jgi:hypothetical protein
MIINSIQNSKYGKKYSVDKKFKLNLHLICIKRLENNDFELKLAEMDLFISDEKLWVNRPLNFEKDKF